MPQLRRIELDSDEEYWKLVDPTHGSGANIKRYLDRNEVAYTKSSSRPRLNELHLRVQRGLPVYDKCSIAELKRFCEDRKLKIPDTAGQSKKQEHKTLLALLEHADEQATFKFLDLPAELRCMVYTMYYLDVQQGRATYNTPLVQPPISHTNRQTRNEALKEFYKTCTFGVSIGRGRKLDHRSLPTTEYESYIYSPRVARFFHAPASVLEQVRNLEIHGRLLVNSGGHEIVWRLEVTRKGEIRLGVHKDWRTVSRLLNITDVDDDPETMQETLMARFQKFVDERKNGGEAMKLRPGDDIAITKLFDPL